MRIYLILSKLLEAGYKINHIKYIEFETGVSALCTNEGAFIETKHNIMEKPGLPYGIKPEWVSYYSFHEYASKIERRRGIYRLRSAQLIFDDPNSEVLEADITSSSIKDAQELFLNFMAGNIFPLPTDDWERPQIERPLRTVKGLLRELWLILRINIEIRLTYLRIQMENR